MVSAHGIMPWHGISEIVDGALTSEDALRLAHLDWKVVPSHIYTEGAVTATTMLPGANPHPVPGFVANVREDTNEVLGIVSSQYVIAQNAQAFTFADELLGLAKGEARYETAGSLKGGRIVWMLINLPTERVLGDDVGSFLAITNSHDGSGALKAFTCATRIVCNNTLHVALKEGRRSVSIRHMSTMDARRHEASRVMRGSSSYFEALRKFAEEVVGVKVDAEDLLKKLFPVPEHATPRVKNTVLEQRWQVSRLAKWKPDLQNFRGTGWGFYNAVSDWYTHKEPLKHTSTYRENRLKEYFEGVDVLERTKDLVLDLV
jgi:phage/plasmid-like protein (TIGR03299 family)